MEKKKRNVKSRKSIREHRWKIAFATAILNDAIDVLGPGSIPIIGDLLDAATTFIIWRLTGRKKAAATLLEFVPGADIVPLYTATVAYTYYRNSRKDS